jgi:hypothetical protein
MKAKSAARITWEIAFRGPKMIVGRPNDLAFLDEMNLFEFLLPDFYTTERHCSHNSIIVVHDCIPEDDYIAFRDPSDPQRGRSSHPNYWAGDV